MKFRFRLMYILVPLLLVLSLIGVYKAAPAAHAASYCKITGTLGSPKVVNLGTHNPITLWSGSGTKHRVYVNYPQRFCPVRVHVNFWSVMYVYCGTRQAVFWYKTFYGRNYAMKTYCAGFHNSVIRFQELRR